MFIFNCLLQKEVKSIGIFPAAIFARVRGGKCWLFLRNRKVLPKAVDRNPNASIRVHVTSLCWVCSFHSLNSSVLIDKMGRIIVYNMEQMIRNNQKIQNASHTPGA